MGRLYYCDYCFRSFQDSAQNRKKHLKSSQHLNAKRIYYEKNQNSFDLLANELKKNVCNYFLKFNFCKFGDNCLNSHLTIDRFEELKQKILYENSLKMTSNESRIDFDFDTKTHFEVWLKNRFNENELTDSSSHSANSFSLNNSNNLFNVNVFQNIFKHLSPQQIPISLIPPKIEDFNESQESDWG
jgi:hypothetical protein